MCCALNVQKTVLERCQKLPEKSLRVAYAFSSQPYRRQALCTERHVPDVSPGNDSLFCRLTPSVENRNVFISVSCVFSQYLTRTRHKDMLFINSPG